MTEGWRKRQIQTQIPMEDAMTDCPSCEYNKQRAQLWRDEAYKHAGHPLPDCEQVGLVDEIRNATLEEVAKEFDAMKYFGDTAMSFAAYVRGMKRAKT